MERGKGERRRAKGKAQRAADTCELWNRRLAFDPMQSVDELAHTITALEPAEQQALIDRVAQLNFQKGLHDLAEKYRARLSTQNRLDVPPEQIWSELHRIRQEIADHDYAD